VKRLNGTVAIVTGAGANIGDAVALGTPPKACQSGHDLVP